MKIRKLLKAVTLAVGMLVGAAGIIVFAGMHTKAFMLLCFAAMLYCFVGIIYCLIDLQ